MNVQGNRRAAGLGFGEKDESHEDDQFTFDAIGESDCGVRFVPDHIVYLLAIFTVEWVCRDALFNQFEG